MEGLGQVYNNYCCVNVLSLMQVGTFDYQVKQSSKMQRESWHNVKPDNLNDPQFITTTEDASEKLLKETNPVSLS